jgi:hypothetical protein
LLNCLRKANQQLITDEFIAMSYGE